VISEPRLEDRIEQSTLGIRTEVPMRDLPTVIPQLTGEVSALLERRGIAPDGRPFIRYHVINMVTTLDVELGFPVPASTSGEGRIKAGFLPAGRYATLIYTGDYAGLMDANAALLEWGMKKSLVWDKRETDDGDAFGARYESYLKDPSNEPDPAKWETEVAIRLADR